MEIFKRIVIPMGKATNLLKYKADCIIGFLWKANVAIAMSLQLCRTPVIIAERSTMNYDLSSFNKKDSSCCTEGSAMLIFSCCKLKR